MRLSRARISAIPGSLAAWLRSVRPERESLRQDAIAGIPGAVGSVPDGMASAVLTGVNPVYGLYASFAGPIGGGLAASTRLMVITTTTAAALAAGSALKGVDPAHRADSLFLLSVLAGVAMIVAGLLRLGRYTRFVSLSVMVGFLTGVAVNIVFGQLADLTGASVTGDGDREGVGPRHASGADRVGIARDRARGRSCRCSARGGSRRSRS